MVVCVMCMSVYVYDELLLAEANVTNCTKSLETQTTKEIFIEKRIKQKKIYIEIIFT